MTQLVDMKDELQRFYIKNEYWLTPVLKALTAFVCFFMIRLRIGSDTMFGSLLIAIAAAALCSFLPWTAVTVMSAVFVLGNAYGTSMELALMAAFILLLMALAQSAFRAGNAILIVLVPLLFYLHVPYVLPIIAGLSLGLMSIVPVSIGVMMYYFIEYISENASQLSVSTKDPMEMASQFAAIFQGYFQNRTMIVSIMAFAICIVLVFILHQMVFSYNWGVAVIVGLLSILVVSAIGSVRFGASFSFGTALIGVIISGILSFLYALAFHGADYKGTERLRFEDDDYFYFVKAIPKLKSGNEA